MDSVADCPGTRFIWPSISEWIGEVSTVDLRDSKLIRIWRRRWGCDTRRCVYDRVCKNPGISGRIETSRVWIRVIDWWSYHDPVLANIIFIKRSVPYTIHHEFHSKLVEPHWFSSSSVAHVRIEAVAELIIAECLVIIAHDFAFPFVNPCFIVPAVEPLDFVTRSISSRA